MARTARRDPDETPDDRNPERDPDQQFDPQTGEPLDRDPDLTRNPDDEPEQQ